MVSEWYVKKEGRQEHLVYLDHKAKELEKLLAKEKNLIIRGAAAKKLPLGNRVKVGDLLYFVETGGKCLVTHCAEVLSVVETDAMTIEESHGFIDAHAMGLNLSEAQYKRWAGKRRILLAEVGDLEVIEAFTYDRKSNMDDWVITDDIQKIKKNLKED